MMFYVVKVMFLYGKQNLNLVLQSCLNWEMKEKSAKNPGKNCFEVRMEWVKSYNKVDPFMPDKPNCTHVIFLLQLLQRALIQSWALPVFFNFFTN